MNHLWANRATAIPIDALKFLDGKHLFQLQRVLQAMRQSMHVRPHSGVYAMSSTNTEECIVPPYAPTIHHNTVQNGLCSSESNLVSIFAPDKFRCGHITVTSSCPDLFPGWLRSDRAFGIGLRGTFRCLIRTHLIHWPIPSEAETEGGGLDSEVTCETLVSRHRLLSYLILRWTQIENCDSSNYMPPSCQRCYRNAARLPVFFLQ